MDAQILGVLRLLGAVPTFNLVFYGRNTLYLENNNLFLFSVLYPCGTTLEVV